LDSVENHSDLVDGSRAFSSLVTLTVLVPSLPWLLLTLLMLLLALASSCGDEWSTFPLSMLLSIFPASPCTASFSSLWRLKRLLLLMTLGRRANVAADADAIVSFEVVLGPAKLSIFSILLVIPLGPRVFEGIDGAAALPHVCDLKTRR
jgi:hypothetical protein